jgi:glycosyltransferase involved in cell wall biosynthesis
VDELPKVSIVVPVYNAVEFLDRSIGSIRNQVLRDIEIILVVDAHCQDDSLLICEKHAGEDERIIILQVQEKGPGYARNVGVELATGEYIGFVDADDFILPEMYLDMYATAVLHDVDIVKCKYLVIADIDLQLPYPKNESKIKVTVPYERAIHYRYPPHETTLSADEYLCSFLDSRLDHSAWTQLISSQICKKTPFVSRWFEDVFYFIHLSEKIKSAIYLDRAYYFYVQHEKMSSWTVRTYAYTIDNILCNIFRFHANLRLRMQETVKNIELPLDDVIVCNAKNLFADLEASYPQIGEYLPIIALSLREFDVFRPNFLADLYYIRSFLERFGIYKS